jgi:hypothetical protein
VAPRNSVHSSSNSSEFSPVAFSTTPREKSIRISAKSAGIVSMLNWPLPSIENYSEISLYGVKKIGLLLEVLLMGGHFLLYQLVGRELWLLAIRRLLRHLLIIIHNLKEENSSIRFSVTFNFTF